MSSDAAAHGQQTDELAATLKRTETLHRSSSIDGRDIVQVRTEIPAGVASGWPAAGLRHARTRPS